MKYEVDRTNAFKRDYKRAKKRGLDLQKLKDIIAKLADGETLPHTNKDHQFSGIWAGPRDALFAFLFCVVQFLWLFLLPISLYHLDAAETKCVS